ncbi:MAG: hypothetical protein AABW92_02195 [Nanoarchaeota archaeon]
MIRRANSKKAQLQIMENVFTIIIIFIILIIAFFFTVVMQKQDQKKIEEESAALNVIKKSQVLSFLPELKCSENNNIDPDCYDILKIEAFIRQINEDNFYYRTLLGNMKFEIVKYDPSPEINSELQRWIVYDNPKPKDMGFTQVQFPILLKDIVSNRAYFGMIFLEVYK